MNDNIDEWLNQLGFTSESPATPNTPAQQSDTQQPQSLSNEDFDDILGDFGFSPTEDAQAEEITEEVGESGEEVENTEESRDLDAEEDADWQEAIDSGGIVPVEFVLLVPQEISALYLLQVYYWQHCLMLN